MKAIMFTKNWWSSEKITDSKKYKIALENAGFRVLKIIEHNFNPQGYTALFLLSESHFAIHTFPEGNKTYFELSSCVKKPFDAFLQANKIV